MELTNCVSSFFHFFVALFYQVFSLSAIYISIQLHFFIALVGIFSPSTPQKLIFKSILHLLFYCIIHISAPTVFPPSRHPCMPQPKASTLTSKPRHLHSLSMAVLVQNCHTYTSKLWGFCYLTRMVFRHNTATADNLSSECLHISIIFPNFAPRVCTAAFSHSADLHRLLTLLIRSKNKSIVVL